ncbi:MAG TPA: alanyl-tRNA editing protein, partial [Planococcus sp. (in: firmicutes)]|nr:alanyl-tRNA editing protein [Planococcus sp. (in: firmicutes)]
MTKELFLEDSYLKECEAEIIAIDEDKITLDQTVFYPAGGGQESDTGILIQDGIAVEVISVKKEGGKIVHTVRDPDKLTSGPVTARIDWERRNQSMKHHTLLHVLAAVFHEDHDSLCTGNQINPDKARIDLTGITELSKDEIEKLVERANQEITRNHEVSVRTLPRAEAEQ